MRQLLTILLLLLSVQSVYAQEAEQPADDSAQVDTTQTDDTAGDAVEVVAPAAASPDQILYAAAARHGVSGAQMVSIVRCETSNYTKFEGDYRNGRSTSHGWGQLHEGGLLGTFYAMGYTDTYDLAQVADFMGYEISIGHRSAWNC